MPVSLKQSLPFKVSDKTAHAFNISHIYHMLRPAYPTSFDQPKFEISLSCLLHCYFPFEVSGFSRSIVDVSAVRGSCAAQVGIWLPVTGTTSFPS
jgi:hypothetical protein